MNIFWNYFRRIIGFLLRNLLYLPIALVLLINIKLHTGPTLSDPASVQADVLAQMAYLGPQLHDHALGKRMQRLIPEGFLFSNVLYGLTWAELAMGAEADAELKSRALAEARWAFKQIDSDECQATFDKGLLPPFGMFYQGWRNYLLAKIVAASQGENSAEVKYFGTLSRVVAACFESSLSAFPDSYPDESWPADACVGVASLALYDRLVMPTHDSLVRSWVARVGKATAANLLPHKTQAQSMALEEGPRGCSGVLNLYFLPDIDTALAERQFSLFHSQFGQSRLGLATVREYPAGVGGLGDVDSGPVVLGVGFSATIVGMGSYLRFGQVAHAQALSDAVEALGFSFKWGGKRYIGGLLPVADLFIAWGRVQRPYRGSMAGEASQLPALASKARFHEVSVGIVLLILLMRYWRRLWRHFFGTTQRSGGE